MDMIADILLVAGALGVAFYCFVLSRRLTRFTDLERGVGGAVAVLSAQVDDLNRALEKAQAAAENSGASLKALTERADGVARRLELHVAAMHDLPPVAPGAEAASAATPRAAEAPEPDLAEPSATLAEHLGSVPVPPSASHEERAETKPAPEPASEPAPAAAKSKVTPPTRSFFASHRTGAAVSS